MRRELEDLAADGFSDLNSQGLSLTRPSPLLIGGLGAVSIHKNGKKKQSAARRSTVVPARLGRSDPRA
jgi:hypothetical protein